VSEKHRLHSVAYELCVDLCIVDFETHKASEDDINRIIKVLEKVSCGFTPMPKYGDLMTLKGFIDVVNGGGFIDYDGSGYYANDKGYFRAHAARPSEVKAGKVEDKFTHVAWFNK